MKFNSIERYEIQAEAFRIMTGHMAPGKDVSAAADSGNYEEREAAWQAWGRKHGECVRAMLTATERIIDRPNDSD